MLLQYCLITIRSGRTKVDKTFTGAKIGKGGKYTDN